MRKLFKIVGAGLLLLAISAPLSLSAPTYISEQDYLNGISNPIGNSTDTYLRYWSKHFRVSYYVLNSVITCESGGDNSKIGKAGEIGIAQFLPDTFNAYRERAHTKGDIYSAEAQIQVMSYMFSIGEQSQWTCYRLLYL